MNLVITYVGTQKNIVLKNVSEETYEHFKNFYFPDDTGYYSYNIVNCFVGNLSSNKQRDLGNELYNWLSKFSYDSFFSIEKGSYL